VYQPSTPFRNDLHRSHCQHLPQPALSTVLL